MPMATHLLWRNHHGRGEAEPGPLYWHFGEDAVGVCYMLQVIIPAHNIPQAPQLRRWEGLLRQQR